MQQNGLKLFTHSSHPISPVLIYRSLVVSSRLSAPVHVWVCVCVSVAKFQRPIFTCIIIILLNFRFECKAITQPFCFKCVSLLTWYPITILNGIAFIISSPFDTLPCSFKIQFVQMWILPTHLFGNRKKIRNLIIIDYSSTSRQCNYRKIVRSVQTL